MKSSVFPAVFLVVFVASVSSRYVSRGNLELDGGNAPKCYDITCPSQTTGCKRIKKTSDDHRKLVTLIECQDDDLRVLDRQTTEEVNPYGKTVQFYSLSYSGTVTKGNFDDTGSAGVNYNNRNNLYNNFGSKLDNEVETF